MPTLSPLALLVAALADVCQQAQHHQLLLSKNEAATRTALIDPILRVLGWDTADLQMVEPEYTVQNKQSLDYILKGHDGTILAVVEAKKLGEPLDKLGHVGALIGYAFSLKPKVFIITDGLHWHCYSPAHSHYEPTTALNLTKGTLLTTALQLLQLLDAAHAGHGLPKILTTQLEPLPLAIPTTFTKSSKATAKKPSMQQVSPQLAPYFTDLSSLSTLALSPGQKPIRLRLPDGTTKAIQTWKDILLEVSRFLLLHKKNLQLPLPDKAGKKRFLFSIEKPAIGSSTAASYQGKTIFICTNYSATDCIANALHAEAQLPAEACKAKVAVAF